MTLDLLPLGKTARIVAVDWSVLVPEEARRLRALGLEEGAKVSLAHRGVFGGKDPLAIAVGRFFQNGAHFRFGAAPVLRRAHAAAMSVELLSEVSA